MKTGKFLAAAVLATALACGAAASAQTYTSYSSVLTGGTLVDFEGQADGTLIDTQFAGVTFSQTPGGRPMIDTYPFLFGYGDSSGENVLTGSLEGPNDFPTVAGLIGHFSTGQKGVEFFLSDTAPLGDYPIVFLGAGDVVLGSVTVAQGSILPPGYSGGFFPPPGTSPLPGIFVGFTSGSADIFGFQVGPSTATGDSFAIDDLRFVSGGGGVPEPASWALMIAGFGLAGATLRRIRRGAVEA